MNELKVFISNILIQLKFKIIFFLTKFDFTTVWRLYKTHVSKHIISAIDLIVSFAYDCKFSSTLFKAFFYLDCEFFSH